MDSAKLNDWMQVVGLFALVASLLFVGYQIKLTRDIAIAETFNSRAEVGINQFIEMAANEQVVAAMTKNSQGRGSDLTPEESTALGLHFRAAMINFGNSFYQTAQGFLPEDQWIGIRAGMKRLISRQPDLVEARRSVLTMPPDFLRELDAVIAEIEAEQAAQ